MLKKVLVYFSVILCFMILFNMNIVYAGSNELINDGATSQLIEIKDKEMKELQDFNEAYGSEAYGFTAYILSKVRTIRYEIEDMETILREDILRQDGIANKEKEIK